MESGSESATYVFLMSSLPEFFLHKREEREANWSDLQDQEGQEKYVFVTTMLVKREYFVTIYHQVVMILRKQP